MLGVKRGDRIAIISENRPEWSLVDLAILGLGAVNVPIYTTQAVEQIRFILENSGCTVSVYLRQKDLATRGGRDPERRVDREGHLL